MEDKKMSKKLCVINNCGECIYHKRVEINKHSLISSYLSYCHRTGLYHSSSTRLFEYCNLPDLE